MKKLINFLFTILNLKKILAVIFIIGILVILLITQMQ